MQIAEIVKKRMPEFDIRVSILGHLQRGGAPSAFDRYLASKLGVAAVEALLDDQRSVMVGLVNNETVLIPFNQAIKHHKDINRKMLEMLYILNT